MPLSHPALRPVRAAVPAALVFLVLGLGGCASDPGVAYGYADPVGPSEVIVPDDYIYYPAYEFYYSPYRHRYIYRDREHWVTHRAPPPPYRHPPSHPPSVHLRFHDGPERHHSETVRQYPRDWKPPPRPAPPPHASPPTPRPDDHRSPSRPRNQDQR